MQVVVVVVVGGFGGSANGVGGMSGVGVGIAGVGVMLVVVLVVLVVVVVVVLASVVVVIVLYPMLLFVPRPFPTRDRHVTCRTSLLTAPSSLCSLSPTFASVLWVCFRDRSNNVRFSTRVTQSINATPFFGGGDGVASTRHPPDAFVFASVVAAAKAANAHQFIKVRRAGGVICKMSN